MSKRGACFACIAAISLAGCETYGVFPIEGDDAGPPPDARGMDAPATDAGPPPVPSISYTPAGCGYTVTTPEVNDAHMDEAVFADNDTGPDHVHVGWAGPTDTTFAVNWHAARDTLASRVLYGEQMADVAAADGAGTGVLEQSGHSIYWRAASQQTRVHEVHVCGLRPSTRYYYKVGGPGHWSAVFSTTTAPAVGSTSPFSFGVTGDSRVNLENAWPISQHRLSDAAVDFQIFTGDAVFLGGNQPEWDDWFSGTDGAFNVQDFLSRAAVMVVNGNHDALAVNYFAQFAMPQEESPMEVGDGEEWYSFDYGNAHFAMLNDSVAMDAVIAGSEADWLRADLDAVDRARTPWVFVVHHRPFYTCHSMHSPDLALRAAWQPIIDQHSVDIVLTGHNHVYERTVPIRGLSGGEGVPAPVGPGGTPTYDTAGLPTGTIYSVVAGAGSDLYEVSTECPTSFVGQTVRAYVIISIEDRTLHYQALNVLTGGLIEEFTLAK